MVAKVETRRRGVKHSTIKVEGYALALHDQGENPNQCVDSDDMAYNLIIALHLEEVWDLS